MSDPPAPAPARVRLDSIDLLRGAVMILMALDHARDFFAESLVNPVDLAHTTPALFATRWVTHFCAPVFSFLAGTSAYLSLSRGKTKRSLAWFLLSRGAWLIVLDLTIVHVGFAGLDDTLAFSTLWALGGAMMVLSALVFLPTWAVATVATLILAGHNALDSFHGGGISWRLLHTGGPIGHHWFVIYPLLPWIGVMAAGYAFGAVMRLPEAERRRWLWTLGLAMMAAFIILRASNLYGDPRPWSPQPRAGYSLLSFVNTQKYPPSLLYTLMTLGPAIVALALLDGIRVSPGHFVVVFGRVPMFFYLIHLFALHIPSWIYFGSKYGARVLYLGFGDKPAGYGLPLWAAYVAWMLAVVALYPLCRWYAGVKARSTSVWLSYL